MSRDETEYSAVIPGQDGNYEWAVRCDETGGYLGITQFDELDKVKERVLLSPNQVEALIRFYRKLRPNRVGWSAGV